MNLVDLVKGQLTPEVIGSLGSLIGTNEAQTKTATAAAVPAMLSGLAKLAGTANGAGQLASALGGLDLGSLGNLAGMLGGSNASRMADKGGSLLGSLFGNSATSMIVETLASFLGIKSGVARSLMSYMAPVVLGQIASQFKGKSIDAQGVQSLFADQARNISAALPAGLSLGDFTAPQLASKPAQGDRRVEHHREPEPAGFPSWLPWLILPLLGLGAWFLMSPKKAEVKAPVVDRTKVIERAPAAQVEPAANLALPAELGDALKIGKDLTGLFGGLTTALGGVKDVATAEQAVPTLKDLGLTLEALKGSTAALPAAGKASIKDMVGSNIGGIRSLVDTVMAIPGVGDLLGPYIRPMLDTLGALGL